MLNVLPVKSLAVTIAIAYALLTFASAIVALIVKSSLTIPELVKFALAGSTALSILLSIAINFAWRRLWQYVPKLNDWIFPDINGDWDMTIHWHNYAPNEEGESGKVLARAKIKQTLLHINMDVFSPNSDSETLIAEAHKDKNSGRPLLYYMFLVTPNNKTPKYRGPYHGAAILKLSNTGLNEFSGNYWTTVPTGGHYELRRLP